jgi:hypothetical protein
MNVYTVPVARVYGVVATVVSVPATFFLMMSAPSSYMKR